MFSRADLVKELYVLNIVLIFLRLIPKKCKCITLLLSVDKYLSRLIPIWLKRY